MTAQSQLEAYLGEFRKRLKSLIVARGAAILAAPRWSITLLAVYFGIRRAFDPTFVYSARAVLVLALARSPRGCWCCRCSRCAATAAFPTSNDGRRTSTAGSKPTTASRAPRSRRRSCRCSPRTR